jgi:hypothetical protein
MEFKLPLRSRNKEIIDYTYVSEEDYEILNKFKWCKSNNYITGKVDKKIYYLHRYIMIEILKNNIDKKQVIDHIDNNPLNNKRDNLRIVSISENNRNKTKIENTHSKYIGVSWANHINKWHVGITIDKKLIQANYSNEHHAAHQYNLWCKQFNLKTAKLNIIFNDHLNDFILYKPFIKKGDNLPKYINLDNNKYLVRIDSKHIGYFNTLEEAISVKNLKLEELKDEKWKKILNIPIKRNNDNIAIIEFFNKNKEKISETLVDDELYYNLIQYPWHISRGYSNSKKIGLMHRYIMNYDGNDYIDHINNNPLDNRKNNLRIASPKENMMNRKANINSTSQYIGVSFDKTRNKWKANITIDNKLKFLGRFESEQDAAKARDEYTKKIFNEFGNLNFDD